MAYTNRNKQREWHANFRVANRQKLCDKGKAVRSEHPERHRRSGAKYRAENPGESAQRVRTWRKNHPKENAASKKLARARKAHAPVSDFTHAQWVMVQEVFDHRCIYCHKRAKGHLTQDHITPLSKGGSHTLTNIVPACRSCNSKKSTGPPLIPIQPLLL